MKSFDIHKIVNEISLFIDEDPTSFYRVIIGSDSQIKYEAGRQSCDFVTAIIVHRQGKGARYFWKKEKIEKKFFLREKIYEETSRSLITASQIVPILRDKISSERYNFEIHIDVGPRGKTREMIKEVVGMVTGSGFVAKTKPESWGASSVADKHT